LIGPLLQSEFLMLLAAGPWAYIFPIVLLVCSNVFMT
jgi:hypothetical protein